MVPAGRWTTRRADLREANQLIHGTAIHDQSPKRFVTESYGIGVTGSAKRPSQGCEATCVAIWTRLQQTCSRNASDLRRPRDDAPANTVGFGKSGWFSVIELAMRIATNSRPRRMRSRGFRCPRPAATPTSGSHMCLMKCATFFPASSV
jgi:hypothetical protein